MASSAAPEESLINFDKQSGIISPLLRGVPLMQQMDATGRETNSGAPLQVPPPSLLYINASQTGWGVHIQGFTSIGT